MKKFIKAILVIILLLTLFILCLSAILGFYKVSKWYQNKRSYDEIYATKSDKSLAQVIENSINLISNSKPLDTFIEEHKKPLVKDLKRYNLNLELNDIVYACYSESVYGIPAPKMLENIGVKNNYAYLIEKRRQIGYGEGSSLFMLIRSNGDVIPIFVSAYFYDIKTRFDFQSGCAKTINNRLSIVINSSLKEKALIILE